MFDFLFITSIEERGLDIKFITEGRYEHSADNYAGETLDKVDYFLDGSGTVGTYLPVTDRFGRHTCIVRMT